MTLTSAQEEEIKRLHQHYPYRIVYATIDKDTGEFFASAVTSMKIPNKLVREGHEVATFKRNSGTRKNPGTADALAKGFHGRKVKERFEIDEEELFEGELAVLGCLVELNITRDDGKTAVPIRGFKTPLDPRYKKGSEVYVAASDRYNIEFVGGDQEILGTDKLTGETKQLLCLGEVSSIVYLADKHHLVGSSGREEEYEHDFGKKKYFLFGKKVGRPKLVYDTLNKTMKLVGGSYEITDEGIKN